MISNRCARKSLVTNCNSIISKNYLQLLVDSNDFSFNLISKSRPFLILIKLLLFIKIFCEFLTLCV